MAQFQYANNPSTTLSGSLTVGATSISVSSATGFPALGKFTIIVDSEIMLVTGVSGTTWTVTRGYDGSTAATHNNNATVTAILTKRSFLNSRHVDVRAYGATGDGSTDDTTAITNAIADIPSEGGVLYFPPGTYKTTGGFTLSKPVRVLGEGPSAREGSNDAITKITCTSATASLFTVSDHSCAFENIALENTASGTASAGAGITVTAGDHMRFRNVSVAQFYIGIDMQDGAHWTMNNVYVYGPVKYGIKVAHDDLVDGGDQSISDSYINAGVQDADAAIRMESGGGMKITNVKINTDITDSFHFDRGIDLTVDANVATSVLLISNTSIENVDEHGIFITTNATSSTYDLISITGCEFGLYGSPTGNAIKIAPNALGDVESVTITGCTFTGSGVSALNAIVLDKVRDVAISNCTVSGFGSLLSTTGCEKVRQTVYTGQIVRVTRTGTQAIPTGGPTAVTWNQEQFDDYLFHSNATNPSRLTVPGGMGGGNYLIGFQASMTSAMTSGALYLRLNGTTYIAIQDATSNATVETVYTLADGDYVEAMIGHASGADRTLGLASSYSPIFWMVRLG